MCLFKTGPTGDNSPGGSPRGRVGGTFRQSGSQRGRRRARGPVEASLAFGVGRCSLCHTGAPHATNGSPRGGDAWLAGQPSRRGQCRFDRLPDLVGPCRPNCFGRSARPHCNADSRTLGSPARIAPRKPVCALRRFVRGNSLGRGQGAGGPTKVRRPPAAAKESFFKNELAHGRGILELRKPVLDDADYCGRFALDTLRDHETLSV